MGNRSCLRPLAVLSLALCIVSVGAASRLNAAIAVDPISVGLYNTGVDASGVKLAYLASDFHYDLAAAPSPVPTGAGEASATNTVSPWILDSASAASRWITPSAYAVSGNSLPLTAPPANPDDTGLYVYTLTFSLPSSYTSFSLDGRWATDNPGQLLLNGVAISTTPGWPNASADPPPFGAWTLYSVSTGFNLGGVNTLEFKVNNFGLASGNPTGLRAEFTAAAATPVVPEASAFCTWAILGLAVGGVRWRRKKRVL